jgi:uncharacterized surface anchored protein
MTAGSNSERSFRLFFRFAMALSFSLLIGPASAMPQAGNIPSAAASSGSYRIAGTVASKMDAHALARARITIRDVKDSKKFQSMITSENGKFEFTGLPAGKYSLSGAKRGFITASYDQHDQYSTAIVTGAGLDTEALLLRLAPDAVIAGKVLDEAGDPVRHATVMLYYQDHSSGVDQIRQNRSAQTDDLGEYELTPLQAGTYFLSATAKPWYAVHPPSESSHSSHGPSSSDGQTEAAPTADRALDVAYPVTYYPDVAEPESAVPIAIQGGEQVQADLHLNPVPSLRLLFRVPGDTTRGFSVPQLQQPVFDGYTSLQTDGARSVSPGLVEVTGVPAGRYDVRLYQQGSVVQMNGVDVSKDGEQVDVSQSSSLSSVKFSVQIPAEAALPPHLSIGLRSGNREIAVSQAVDAKGQAELPQVAVGRYEVAVWGGGKPYSIARMSAEGAEVSGHTLAVAGGSKPSVSLMLISGSTEIRGKVTQAGKAFAGAMVVLVPKNPELDRDLFRRDQSDLDGTFALRGVVPGSYTLLAIENGWDLDWSQATVITAYLKHGRRIEAGSQPGRPMNVADPIGVQSK